MERFKIDGYDLRNMMINASNNLEDKKEFVNSLNVFPVPDGDTGTNMSMTFRSAVAEAEKLDNNSISEVARKIARGALMGARGNSGVILSQIFRGIAKGLEGKYEVDAVTFANSIQEGSKYAYKAVMRPTEGTILTIIRAAAESAANANESDIVRMLDKVCKFSKSVLDKTPDMLPALKEAKVVDAGGMGLLIVLEGMYEALNKNIQAKIEDVKVTSDKDNISKPAQSSIQAEDIKFGYCTEFFVHTNDAAEKSLDLKRTFEPIGDSMIVIGVDDVIKVHIHTNDPGFVLSEAVKLGELSKIKIDNMREEHRKILELEYATTEEEVDSKGNNKIIEETEYGFVSVTIGNGLKNIFKDLGVDWVIEGGQTMNPSTQDIIECINKINAKNIFVLPNNKNIIMAAEQAAKISEKNIIVIPTKTIPQGITAVTAFNPDSAIKENIDAMNLVIESVCTGSVTYAVRDTEMDGKVIKEGNILGLVEGKISEVGKDIFEVCDTVVSNMITDESELVTIFYGKDCNQEKVEEFIIKLEERYPEIDIQCYSGEQPLYYFIMSVE